MGQRLIDNNFVINFVDDNGVQCFIDDLGNFTCDQPINRRHKHIAINMCIAFLLILLV